MSKCITELFAVMGEKLTEKEMKKLFEKEHYFDNQTIANLSKIAISGPEPYKSMAIKQIESLELLIN